MKKVLVCLLIGLAMLTTSCKKMMKILIKTIQSQKRLLLFTTTKQEL